MASAPESIIDHILGPNGAIARRLPDRYEHRPQQLDLSRSVAAAIESGRHLLAEAGTGVGKSFAYLVPAIDFAIRTNKRVVISTHTIALQEQLIAKDIPLLRSVFPDEFAAVLVKGRSNYLCLRRLKQSRSRQSLLFETEPERASLLEIESWAQSLLQSGGAAAGAGGGGTGGGVGGGVGSVSELKTVPLPQVWDKVAAEHGNCLGKQCEFYDPCFWQAAKRRMQSGKILIVNHALFFSDLALRLAGVNYLPKYDVAILDEAHTIEDVASQHFGIKVSEATIKYQLRTLYDLRRGKGLLSSLGSVANDAITAVIDLGGLTEEFFERAVRWYEEHGRGNGRIREPHIIDNPLSPAIRNLGKLLNGLTGHTKSEEEIAELRSIAAKLEGLAAGLDALVSQSMPDAVYWLEVSAARSGARQQSVQRVVWNAAPIDIAKGLQEALWSKLQSVILTSATLCTSSQSTRRPQRAPIGDTTPAPSDTSIPENFRYITSRLGAPADRSDFLHAGSPFDYTSQCKLYIHADLPDPADRTFPHHAQSRILHYLRQTRGGAFVLFTAYRPMQEFAQTLRPRLEELGFPLLVQGQDAPRHQLLESFRTTPNSVLFGTASFWQGVDVQGDALRNVIITKLPFSVPDEPLTEAKLEAITRAGGNAFMQYSLPEAIIRLKQGFGRLIRSRSDKGIVVILDSRIVTKRYGQLFLNSLPPCNLEVIHPSDSHDYPQ